MRASSLFFTMPKTDPKKVKGSLASSFWLVLGILVCATLLAKWTWVFIAPEEVALPSTTAWKKGLQADHIFGDVALNEGMQNNSLGNVQLVGVFAHPREGFAVLSIEGKQTGVGLGELVMPNARLIEVHADHVMIERFGIKSRIDLLIGAPIAGITNAGNDQNIVRPTAITMDQLSPQQKTAMQQELQHFRGKN